MAKIQEKIKEENWHGCFLRATWQDEQLSQAECFGWLRNWTSAPTHTIAGVMELYEQLTPTKVTCMSTHSCGFQAHL